MHVRGDVIERDRHLTRVCSMFAHCFAVVLVDMY